MRHEEFLKEPEDISEYIYRYDKTVALIGELAKHGTIWSQESINRAITETRCFDFSTGDVAYMTALTADREAQDLERKINGGIEAMQKMEDVGERIAYYRANMLDLYQRREARQEEIKSHYNVLFYAHDKGES